jgi:hypothetical protein
MRKYPTGYIFFILGHPEVHYKMFVPLGAPIEAVPGFQAVPPPPSLVPNLCISPSAMAPHLKKPPNDTLSTIPLDLRKSPGVNVIKPFTSVIY